MSGVPCSVITPPLINLSGESFAVTESIAFIYSSIILVVVSLTYIHASPSCKLVIVGGETTCVAFVNSVPGKIERTFPLSMTTTSILCLFAAAAVIVPEYLEYSHVPDVSPAAAPVTSKVSSVLLATVYSPRAKAAAELVTST